MSARTRLKVIILNCQIITRSSFASLSGMGLKTFYGYLTPGRDRNNIGAHILFLQGVPKKVPCPTDYFGQLSKKQQEMVWIYLGVISWVSFGWSQPQIWHTISWNASFVQILTSNFEQKTWRRVNFFMGHSVNLLLKPFYLCWRYVNLLTYLMIFVKNENLVDSIEKMSKNLYFIQFSKFNCYANIVCWA